MNIKKNLTFMTLATLLAIPAFSTNATRVSANTKAPSPGYAKGISNLGGNTKIPPAYTGNTGSQDSNDNHYAFNNKNGQANKTNSSSNKPHNNSNPEYQGNNTNNGKLVQTGESDDASKIAAVGDVALAAGASLAALSFAEKHRDLAKEDIATDTISTVNNSGYNKPNHSNKSSYDMIMSNTFTKLSENLKDM